MRLCKLAWLPGCALAGAKGFLRVTMKDMTMERELSSSFEGRSKQRWMPEDKSSFSPLNILIVL